ncbi:MAG: hypothetical protein HN919_22560, partial [Verrucomicrobia bacterium]|nr:hypothetical protein [Verrucomicrobiota bacterium]
MNRNHACTIGSLVTVYSLSLSLSVSAAAAWVPKFNDAPVTPEQGVKVVEALPTQPIVKPKARRRLLVFSATSGFRHKSIPIGNLALRKMGEATGAYEAVTSNDPANFEPSVLKGFDAVVMLNPTQDFFMPNRKQKREFSDEEWAALESRHSRLVDNLI